MNHTRPIITEHALGCQRTDCKGCGCRGTVHDVIREHMALPEPDTSIRDGE